MNFEILLDEHGNKIPFILRNSIYHGIVILPDKQKPPSDSKLQREFLSFFERRLRKKEDLFDGQIIWAPCTHGFVIGTVLREGFFGGFDDFYWQSGQLYGSLEFGSPPDHEYWYSSCTLNLNGIFPAIEMPMMVTELHFRS